MLKDTSSPAPARVLLADDHDILRQGLKLLLSLQPAEIEVVGEARTGREAVELARTLQPDVVVMDITMPDMDGLEACRILHQQQPRTQVLMLTMHESEEYFLQALRVGAAGYIVKKAAPTELCLAITSVAQGGAFLYPGLAKVLIRGYVERSRNVPLDSSDTRETDRDSAAQLHTLTPREMEVLKLVAEGHSNQEIADQLVISIKTVQAHRANVMEKLGLRNVTHLVRFAVRAGLIVDE